MKYMRAIVAVLVAVSVAVCTTLVRIESEPPDAKVYLNRQPSGTTPLSISLSNFIFNEYDISIEKEGFEDLESRLNKEFKVAPFVGGLFVWPLLLWVYGPEDYQAY